MSLERFEEAWDRPRVDLELLSELLEGPSPAPEAVLARVPVGLVHAASIFVAPDWPSGYAPLGTGSAWAAADRDLAVRVAHDPTELLCDLAHHFRLAQQVFRRLHGADALARRMCGAELRPADRPDLAARLGLDGEALRRLEDGGWIPELGWMGVRPFSPRLRVAAELRPSAARARGAAAGEALAARLPQEGAPVLVFEDPVGLDLFSPYPRDLGHALRAWGLENPDRLRTEGLAEALHTETAPEADLSTLVAADLMAAEPDRGLLEERRVAERAHGLVLEDRRGLTFGWAELSALAERDPCLDGARGAAALLAGPSREALGEAVGVLLESGRIGALGLVGRLALAGTTPVIPDALATARDGFALPGATELRSRAESLEIAVGDVGLLELAPGAKSGAWIAEAVGRARREMVRGRVAAELLVYAAFHPTDSTIAMLSLEIRRAALRIARVVVSAVLLRDDLPAKSSQSGVSTNRNRPFGRRFRA